MAIFLASEALKNITELLKKLNFPKTTFNGLRDTHASYLFSQDMRMDFLSERLGNVTFKQRKIIIEKRHEEYESL